METSQRLSQKAMAMLGLLVMAPVAAGAAEMQAAIDVGVAATDNVERSFLDDRSDIITSAGLLFSLRQESRRFTGDLGGELAYTSYRKASYDSDLLGNVRGSAEFQLVEDRLSWFVEDRFGQSRRDLFEAPSADNLENVNYLTTGPTLSLQILRDWSLTASGRYGRTDHEESPLDTEQYDAALGILRALTGATTLSFNATASRVRPSSTGEEDSDQLAAFVGYDLRGARTTLTFNAGASRVEQADDTDTGATLTLQATRRVGNRSKLAFEVGREHSQGGETLQTGSGGLPVAGLESSLINQSTDPFVRTFARVGWNARGRITDINLGVGWDRESPAVADMENRYRAGISGDLSRQFGPRLTGHMRASYSRTDFGQVFHEVSGEIGATWNLGRRTFLDLSTEYYSFELNGQPNTVQERRVWLRFGYGSSTLRSQGPARAQ